MPGLKLQILEEKNLDNIHFIPIFIGPFLKIAFFAPPAYANPRIE